MRVLLRNHGMNVLGVKANLYTAIGNPWKSVRIFRLIDPFE